MVPSDAFKHSEQKVQESLNDELENDRKLQLLMDAKEIMQETTICRHTPDSQDIIDWEYRGDEVMCLLRCRCGKAVTEIFKYFETRISD